MTNSDDPDWLDLAVDGVFRSLNEHCSTDSEKEMVLRECLKLIEEDEE